jgi:hypothetical protein
MTVHLLEPVQTSVSAPPERGDMGLRGLWAQVFHSTAMVAIVMIAFLALWQLQRMHDEAMNTLRDFNAQLVGQIRSALDANTASISRLSDDLRNLRRNP